MAASSSSYTTPQKGIASIVFFDGRVEALDEAALVKNGNHRAWSGF